MEGIVDLMMAVDKGIRGLPKFLEFVQQILQIKQWYDNDLT